ncbi:hypothetical protein EYS14_14150 [Alteromonadaceae bacterium M269]|nr:hypothetical protein EYS14_14150 [Alteromonadaceae bacterium M269]
MISTISEYTSKGKAVILNYHRVSEHQSIYDNGHMKAHHFENHLRWLSTYYNVIPLPELYINLQDNSLPPRAACITIDDGYYDSYSVIFPLLKKYGLQATFFVSTEGLETGSLWDEDIKYSILNLPSIKTKIEIKGDTFDTSNFENRLAAMREITHKVKYMSLDYRKEYIEQLSRECENELNHHTFINESHIVEMVENGMDIGSHAHSHPILAKETDEISRNEIAKSKSILESMAQTDIDFFAYPNGKHGADFDDRHVGILKELGFKGAVTTEKGVVSSASDVYQMPRFTPWDKSKVGFCGRLITNFLGK